MGQISMEFALQLGAQGVLVLWAVAKVNTKIAVLQVKVSYIERALKQAGSIPADLG